MLPTCIEILFIVIGALIGRIISNKDYLFFNGKSSDFPENTIIPVLNFKLFLVREIVIIVVVIISAYLYISQAKPYYGYYQSFFAINYSMFLAVLYDSIPDIFTATKSKNKSDNNNDDSPTHNSQAIYFVNPFLFILLAALILNGFCPVFFVACFGGLIVELYDFYKKRAKKFVSPSLPYWIISALMIISGGILTTFYGTENVSALAAVQIGASAPLIIGRFRSKKK